MTKESQASSGGPSLAVVICTRDRPDALLETLDSIWRQTRLPDELILIDDGQLPEGVRDRIAARCRELGVAWQFERSRRGGLTASRNQAADLARSDILEYLDDDVTCDTGFLAEIVRVMSDPRVAGATAAVREPVFETRSGRLYQFGYRLAGWWKVRPRGRPPAPMPAVLRDSSTAVRAEWLVGPAMALRRDLVRANRFDETLVDYALGEDREMGYRLAPPHWIVQARRAALVHHRATGRRTNGRRLGFMTSYNYLYILNRTCRLGPGEWLLIGWGLAVIAAMHALWVLAGSRGQHLAEMSGMVEGLLAFLRSPAKTRARIPTCVGTRTSGNGGMPALALGMPPSPGSSRRWHLRALFVTNRLEPGGAERMLLALVKHLPEHGIEPLIGCLKDAGPLAGECHARGVPVFEHLLHFKTDAAVLPRLLQLVRAHRIDVIVVAHSGGDRMFWSTIAGRLARVPVVVWSHWYPIPLVRHFERANRLLFRWVEAYVALGERHRLGLVRLEYVPAGRITVIPNAIEIGPFLHAAERTEVRRRLGLADEHVAVAIIANFRPGKRHDVFIQAAKRLAAEDPRLRFFIVGDGPNREAVRAMAAAAKVPAETLRLLGARHDIPDLLRAFDISCLCSEKESFSECFSVSMLEAAAAGCVFIGPDSGCMPDFLDHRRNGLLIKPADANALTDAIRELAGDPDLRQRLAAAAQAKVTSGFDLDTMAREFAELLSRVAESAGPANRSGPLAGCRGFPTIVGRGRS